MDAYISSGQNTEHIVQFEEKAVVSAPMHADEGAHGKHWGGPDLNPADTQTAAELEGPRGGRDARQDARAKCVNRSHPMGHRIYLSLNH